jgi:NAD(P)-dependent dehydrogenase (short-subunit alcohol dehydrogenase family)
MRLQDKVAIVTGGGSGIGTAYTRRFLAEGMGGYDLAG